MKKEISGSIVELTINDLDRCGSFWDIPSKLVEPIRKGERKAFAYKIDNEFVGGCALSIKNDDCGHFSYFAVAADFRGNGIGSRIIDFAVNYFKSLGLTQMRLHVQKNNFNAIRLYERNGFVYECDVTNEEIAMIKEF
ncbi:MAG: GNAT family N-acetyltransferase [Eubacterium sp.]|nr:GNAT family N-acetyltransferase [Eubacterium sp.]